MTDRSTISFGRRLALCAVAIATVFSAMPVHGRGQNPKTERVRGHDAAAGEVLVKFKGTPSGDLLARFDRHLDADRHVKIGSRGAHRVHSRSFDTASLLSFLQVQPEVEYAEPNYIVYASDTIPNDPSFPQLWGLSNPTTPGADISAVKAWDVSTGSASVVVAVIDTGVDYNHPDLAANIWSAPTSFNVTIGSNTYNCPAGSHGFNAIANTCDPMDDNNHGTHVSGTIGAVGNNGVGVAGVNWTTRIMGAKFLSAGGSGYTSDAVKAVQFIEQAKQHFGGAADVRVLSNSWGGGGFSQTLANEIAAANAADMLFVAAAGNSAANNDTGSFYPANYTNANVLAVAATNQTDGLAYFSNYGATTVDLGAPGVGIVSTTRNNTYSSFSGTSMATPHVSGTAALVLSRCSLDTAALKANLMANVTPLASLAGITVTGGRLNADASIRACSGGGPVAPPAPTGLAALAGNAQVSLSWNQSSGATSYTVKRSTSSGAETSLVAGVTVRNYVDYSVTNGTKYYYVVTAVGAGGPSGSSNEVSATPTAPPVVPSAPGNLSASASGKKKIGLQWNASTGATSYRVKRATVSGGPYTNVTTVTGTSFTNTGLQSGATYYYVVTAINAAGESTNSNQASAKAR